MKFVERSVNWGERPCFQDFGTIGLGQTGLAESENTKRLQTVTGVKLYADWALRDLNLKEINPEWLAGIVEPRSNQYSSIVRLFCC